LDNETGCRAPATLELSEIYGATIVPAGAFCTEHFHRERDRLRSQGLTSIVAGLRAWLARVVARLVCHQDGHVYRLRMHHNILGLWVWWYCPRCRWSSDTELFPTASSSDPRSVQ
jgi:hypothetical protein